MRGRIPAHGRLSERDGARACGGDGRALGMEAREEGMAVCESGRAFSAKAAVKPAVSTNVRNIYLHELNPAYTL